VAPDLQGACTANALWSKLTTQALTLLEYLIKHGAERVVDDARAHVSTIKMLRNFHYIDEKGKDQGINGEL
jgi:epsin